VTYVFLYGRTVWRKPQVYLSMAVAGLAFLVVTPYAILDASKFVSDTIFHLEYYSSASHPGMEGSTLDFYLTYLVQTDGLLPFIGLATALTYLKPRNRTGLILASFVVPYMIYVSSLRVRNDRTILIALPILLIMAADGLLRLWRRLALLSDMWRFGWRVAIAIFVTASIVFLGVQTVTQNVSLMAPDVRETARQWITSTIPAGTHIAAESYAPFIDPHDYRVDYFGGLRLNSPDWYVAHGYDLLVFSSGAYQRFYQMPELYPTEIAQYDALFSRFPLIAEFEQNGGTIRILKVKS
jgi:hypothetical protein